MSIKWNDEVQWANSVWNNYYRTSDSLKNAWNATLESPVHVVIDNVKTGYGIFITTMLEEGEKN